MDLVLRTVFVFFLILVVTRAVGRRELSSMEPFDLILLVVGTAYLSFRFRRLRPLLEGEPVLLISDGDVLRRNLRRQRLTVEELEAEARRQSIEALDDVRYAVLETSGKISFLSAGS
jgi:uncharacterized membrane protein YcaP (DUF421 family)